MVVRGFTGRQSGSELSDRIPRGQHLVDIFPVHGAGPTPRIDPGDWTFMLKVGPCPVKAWSWSEFNALPRTGITRDIHGVTSLSKLNIAWEGVAVDDVFADAGINAPTPLALTHAYDAYSTNVPLADLTTGKAMVALRRATIGAGAPARAASLLTEAIAATTRRQSCATVEISTRTPAIKSCFFASPKRSTTRQESRLTCGSLRPTATPPCELFDRRGPSTSRRLRHSTLGAEYEHVFSDFRDPPQQRKLG